MKNKTYFSIEDAKIIDENPNSSFAIMELDFFASGQNLHDMYVSEETLLRTADTIKNCPLVWKYDEELDDVYTHTPDEVPCGFVPEHATISSRVLEDGRTMLSVLAYVWKRYTGELLSFFKRDGGVKPVSVEMSVLDTKERPDGLLELLDYRFEGITVLGTYVTPAIPLAKATVLSFSKEYEEVFKKEFSLQNNSLETERIQYQENGEKVMPYSSLKDMNPALKGIDPPITLAQANSIARQADAIGSEKGGWGIAIKHFKDSHKVEDGRWVKKELMSEMAYDDIDFKIPEAVKNNAKKGLELRKQYGRGGTNVGIASARYLSGNDKITPEKVRHVAKYFPRHKGDNLNEKDPPSNGYIAWLLWGGDTAWKWAQGIVDKMDSQDEKRNFAMEELGKKDALKINKSKDSLSTSPWGSVDKTSLMHKVLAASNYKSLVNDVYMLVESGWEEHPSSSLKYPVMQLKGDTLVYNRYGLSAALQRAVGQNETKVVSKVKTIYEKMGLNEGKKEEMSMLDEKDLKKENMGMPPMPSASMGEVEVEVEGDGQDNPEEEKAEDMAAPMMPMGEASLKPFMYPSNFNAETMMSMFAGKETEEIACAVDELMRGQFADPTKVMAGMFAKMCKMSDMIQKMAKDAEVYMAQNEELKKFKADMEERQKAFEVESTLKQLAEKVAIPAEAKEEMVAEAQKYSFSNIDAWKTYCKAKSFDFSVVKPKDESNVERVGMPFSGVAQKREDLWS